MDQAELDTFIARYVSMWHEPDPERRADIIRGLWAEDAENFTRRFVARGFGEIVGRVTRAHDEWVAAKGFVFEPIGNTDSHNHLVKFFWRMRPREGGPAASLGLDIFVLNPRGKIQSLYQFSEPDAK